MKSLVLHHLPVVSQEIHTQLQMLSSFHIFSHDIVIISVEQDLSQQLNGLPFRNIGTRTDENCVIAFKEEVEICFQILAHEALVFREDVLDREG